MQYPAQTSIDHRESSFSSRGPFALTLPSARHTPVLSTTPLAPSRSRRLWLALRSLEVPHPNLPVAREKAALEAEVGKLRAQAADWELEQQRLEAMNQELQRYIRLGAEQQEARVQQMEQDRRQLQSR